MDKSRCIWEEVPVSPHNVPNKFRDYYRHLLPAGLMEVEPYQEPDSSGPKVSLNHNANTEIMDAVGKFCKSHAQILHEVGADIPMADIQKFVVEMTHRFRIIEMNEHSDFAGDLTNIGNLVTRGSISVIRKAALSYIAFYYFEHTQKAEQDKVVSMEDFRDRTKHAIG